VVVVPSVGVWDDAAVGGVDYGSDFAIPSLHEVGGLAMRLRRQCLCDDGGWW